MSGPNIIGYNLHDNKPFSRTSEFCLCLNDSRQAIKRHQVDPYFIQEHIKIPVSSRAPLALPYCLIPL